MQKMLEKSPDILLSRGGELEDEYKKVYRSLCQ